MSERNAKVQEVDSATAFVELLTAHQREMYAYINSLLIGRGGAADVLQDTNLDLWKQLNQYDFSRPFLPWALGFAYQNVMASRRKFSRSKLVFSDETLQLISDAYRHDVAEEDLRLAALRNCVEKLDPAGRELIRERYLVRIPVQAMASQTGATANQISARLYRVRRMLARCVETTLAREA